MAKRNIYFDATPLIEKHISGVGKVLQETLKAMDTVYYAEKYNMYIFVPFNEASKAKLLNFTHIKLKLLPYPHKFFSLFTRMRWSPPIDLFLGKGVYVFQNFRNVNLLFSKSITYIHDVAFKIYPEYIQELNLAYLNKYIDLWIDRADQIVAISESSKQDIVNVLGLTDVQVVPNAVNIHEFKPASDSEIARVRADWDIPENYFVFIGNIEPRKNLTNTINAFVEYIKKNNADEALVVIGGGGWSNEPILNAIEDARNQGVNIIRPNGYVPDKDLPGVITGAKALFQLSWHEGFGLPVLQALACGVPVVASDIASIREAAKGNTDRVVFVKDASDTTEIANAIGSAVKKNRIESMKNIAAWEESVGNLESLIDSM